jgi:hypothetical protein
MTGTKEKMTGRCLCGQLTYDAQGKPSAPHACHCDDCQRFAGTAFIGLDFDTLDISGPIHWFQSSDWGERGSCKTCGSGIFWRLRDGSGKQVVTIGSLDDASNLPPIDLHFFADNCDPSYNFAKGSKRLTRAETMALFAGASE